MTEDLSLEKTRLNAILEGTRVGTWEWNVQTGEAVFNERWATMLGYSHEEIQQTAQQWTDFVFPEDRTRAWDSIAAVLAGQSSMHRLEYRMLHKDGSLRWIS